MSKNDTSMDNNVKWNFSTIFVPSLVSCSFVFVKQTNKNLEFHYSMHLQVLINALGFKKLPVEFKLFRIIILESSFKQSSYLIH